MIQIFSFKKFPFSAYFYGGPNGYAKVITGKITRYLKSKDQKSKPTIRPEWECNGESLLIASKKLMNRVAEILKEV